MGDVLQQAADRLEAAASDIAALEAGDDIAAFLNNISVALSSLGNAVNAAASAFAGSLSAEAAPVAEGAPLEDLPPAEG